MIDWIAMILVLLGTVLVGRKNKSGWIAYIASNILWFIYAARDNQIPLATMQVFLLVANITALATWHASDRQISDRSSQ